MFVEIQKSFDYLFSVDSGMWKAFVIYQAYYFLKYKSVENMKVYSDALCDEIKD